MKQSDIDALCRLNRDFYQHHAQSFSATRQAPWQGWTRLLAHIEHELAHQTNALRVLDCAAGNLRFAHFLQRETHLKLNLYDALDITDSLLHATPHDADTSNAVPCDIRCSNTAQMPSIIQTHTIDILKAVRTNTPLPGQGLYNLAVSFGFMHHIPSSELRIRVFNALIQRCVPGACIALSFWQFMNDNSLAKKTAAVHAYAKSQPELQAVLASLEPHDHLLAWQQDYRYLRYCHHFDDSEIDDILAASSAPITEIVRFSADGANGNLNRYLLVRRM
ncbi:hypothetical protein KPC83_05215 [Collinsella sp. zg1085]|uniref:hypothetical protein n=1 Tax=Collinsella sp. zg1085 TaxID=2844380 RepID=UPI001C0BFC50|nr:hypothetical protein [Collinsella sp. zg1085]QWT17244.1 hypothetical protein KPC83_05215 [Collinsella sp. zg1085]